MSNFYIHYAVIKRQRKRDKLLKELSYADYSEYQRSEHWEKLKTWFASISPPKCLLCEETVSLQLHHCNYYNMGAEGEKDVVWLCGYHHELVHQSSSHIDFYRPPTSKQTSALRRKYRMQLSEISEMNCVTAGIKLGEVRVELTERTQNEHKRPTDWEALGF